LEQQRSEFIETTPPRLPFVRRLRGHIEDAVNSSFLERFDIHLGIAAEAAAPAATVGAFEFTAAVADEHELNFLLEGESMTAFDTAMVLIVFGVMVIELTVLNTPARPPLGVKVAIDLNDVCAGFPMTMWSRTSILRS
jgi:hypothetical protein